MNIDNPPAFPQGHLDGPEIDPSGMSLRDYFAAKAFERFVQAHIDQSVDDLTKEVIATESYSYADWILRVRSRPIPTTIPEDKMLEPKDLK